MRTDIGIMGKTTGGGILSPLLYLSGETAKQPKKDQSKFDP